MRGCGFWLHTEYLPFLPKPQQTNWSANSRLPGKQEPDLGKNAAKNVPKSRTKGKGGDGPSQWGVFKNLWIASLVQTLLPALTLIALPYLIPNASQTEKLMTKKDDGCRGSVWRRWRGEKAL